MTETLRNNLLGLPLDLPDDQHDAGPLRGHPAAERGSPADLRRDQRRRSSTPYTSWVDFGQHLKHPESLINFVAAYGSTRRSPAQTTLAGKRAAAELIVNAGIPADAAGDRHPVPATSTGRRCRLHEQHRRLGQRRGSDSITGLDNVDLWVGGLAEITNLFGGLLGTHVQLRVREPARPTCRTATGSTTWPARRA